MIKLPSSISRLMQVFRDHRYQIYVVGGAVRDALLDLASDNWDFATSATPEQIQQLFPDSFYHNQYGTVSVPSQKLIFEITPFRQESDYRDARHPRQIRWAKTIEQDLSRRDFTVNAMAFDGKTLVDPWHGADHLREKKIKTVGDPFQRFREDGLRLMRAVRLAAQLGFFIEESTRQAIRDNAQLIEKISAERVRDELMKIIASPHPADGVLFLHNTGLLHYILPELEACFSVPQKSPKRHHIFDVGTHAVMALKHCPSADPVTRLATLLHDIGKVQTFRKDAKTGLITFYNHEVVGTRLVEKIAQRLKFSNQDKAKLVTLVKYHQFTVTEVATDKAIRRFIRQVGKENLNAMLDLRTGDRIGSGAKPTSWRLELFKKRLVEVQKEPFKVTDLKINGHDVMETLRLSPGPAVGQILAKVFARVVDGQVKNQKPDLIKLIKQPGFSTVH
ncbi:CCA tRNA nucleotidyltransferase [Patescibacteria group bacterium]|nr:CCA tRNA nucleotidyltransferase [Patescibacteria group bacterium]MCL5091638.1 CCA tRNA nucleotidyltransferase [Patescibacteria group bacterium]